MPFPLVTPHQDGSGTIDRIGASVSENRVGERVWLYMAHSRRAMRPSATHEALETRKVIGKVLIDVG